MKIEPRPLGKRLSFCKTDSRIGCHCSDHRSTGRSAASIGANYAEGDDAESKKDFRHKIGICRKESKEAKHWLRMIAAAEAQLMEQARILYKEAMELNLIFGAIRRKLTD